MSEHIEQDMSVEEETQKGKYLTFTLGREVYGLEIKYVTEIIGLQPITEVPDLPGYVMGIINLRGQIIPVIDMRLRFKKPQQEYNERTCIIVVDIGELGVGLIVDTVAEVLAIAEEDIALPPNLQNNNYTQRFIKAIGKVGDDVKLILDGERVLSAEEISLVENIG